MPVRDVKSVLSEIEGISAEAIDIYYRQIRLSYEIPYEIRIPNKVTRKVFKDSEAEKNKKSFNNIKGLLKDLKN